MSRKKTHIKILYNAVIFALVIAGCSFVAARFIKTGEATFTDNAQVRKHLVPVNVRVQGYIGEILFNEYSHVSKGDTLVLVCDQEFRLRVTQAEASLAGAESSASLTRKEMATARNNADVAGAAIEESRYELENAEREYERYRKLYEGDAVTRQQYDDMKTRYDVARTRYDKALLQKKAALLSLDELEERLVQDEARVRLARAALELARLDLSYTAVTASCDGVTGKKQIAVGQLVQPGQTLLDMVDNSDTWVIANYRERQLKNISAGDRVEIKVDAVPGKVFSGMVESLSDATGASYSIFPQDNATGNFVKTEQRVPVRIVFEHGQDLSMLRSGMNVECSIRR